MNNKAIEAFAERSIHSQPAAIEFETLRSSEGATNAALLDALARAIAIKLLVGSWSFEPADRAVNNLWALLTSNTGEAGWEIPQFFYSVYQAFEAGEYPRYESVYSAEKTKQLLESILVPL